MNIESKMEVYEANYSYNQQADSVLTFNAGEKFYILGRPTDKWWFAKRLVDNMFGYVPAAYLQPAKEKVIGKLVPEKRRDTKEHNIHLEALAEIHRKVKPLPAHVIENALAMDAKPQSPSAKSGPASPPKSHQPHPRETMSPPPSFGSSKGKESQLSPSPSRTSSGRQSADPRRSQSVKARPTYLSESFPQPDYKTSSQRKHSPQWDADHFQFSDNNNIVRAPWSSKSAKERSPPPQLEDESPSFQHGLPSPPLLSPPPPDYDLDDDEFRTNGRPYHHQLNISGRSEGEHILIPDEDEEELLIKPRPLVNPVLNSKERQDLHRELKQSGKKVLEQPELKKVFRDRRITEKKKEAERHEESRRTSMEIKLMERQEMLEKEEQRQKMAKEGIVENDEDALKPEFAKLKLRQTNSSKT
ncbi:hypothetical protein HOLleu_04861 [Holothuria leucospilota]|uniref:SH3 domain-containing protein n=1 Tax=Holothuria leucospilota TaxID=206669 RepID=A0A9Q1HIK3_HOLLE|nr:hypothetical protein HOLleu_04861 [Holothuria leucospilota]